VAFGASMTWQHGRTASWTTCGRRGDPRRRIQLHKPVTAFLGTLLPEIVFFPSNPYVVSARYFADILYPPGALPPIESAGLAPRQRGLLRGPAHVAGRMQFYQGGAGAVPRAVGRHADQNCASAQHHRVRADAAE